MIDSLGQIEEMLQSTDYYETKKKILIFRSNLKLKRGLKGILDLKKDADTYFKQLNNVKPELSLMFYRNIRQFYDELYMKANQYHYYA